MTGYILFFLLLLLILNSNKPVIIKQIASFVVIVLFAAIRDGIGFDYYLYLDLAGSNLVNREIEPIPFLFAEIARHSNSYLFFLFTSIFIYAFVINGIAFSTKNISNGFCLSMFLFICFPYFFYFSLGIIRQFMAIAILFWSICRFWDQRWKLLIGVIVASLCHQSAVAGLILLVPLDKIKCKYLWCLVILSFVIDTFIIEILTRLPVYNSIVGKLIQYIELADEFQGGRIVRYLVYLTTVLSLLFYKRLTANVGGDRIKYYIACVCIGCFLQNVLSISPHMSMRMCTYFFVAILCYFPQLLVCLKVKRSMAIVTLIALFAAYMYTNHISNMRLRSQDGRNESCVYPYRTILFN